MSPRGVWTDAEWSAVESLLVAYWPDEERLPTAQQRLWRRVLSQYRPERVIDALDELHRRRERPSLNDISAVAQLVPADVKRAG